MKNVTLVRDLLFLTVLTSMEANADLLRSIPDFVQMYISPQRGWAGSVGTLPPTATVAGFAKEDFGRWFTLANGPEFVNLFGGHSAAFTGQLIPDNCKVKDDVFALDLKTWDQKQTNYQLQTKQLNRCLQLRVKDLSGIAPAEVHPACEVEKINQFEVIARGGLCYFKVNPNSAFSVTYETNPECTDPNNFSRLELNPLDIFAYSGFYLSGDASGRSTYLKPLGSSSLRFSIEAPPSDVNLSVDMGEGNPRWPVQAFPDVHMGEVQIESKGDESRIVPRVFFRNNCNEEGSLACQYAIPIGVQYTLKELVGEKTRTLDQWYTGGVSPAFWEGFFPTQRDISNFRFEPGRRYRVEADLTYLSLYHRLFKEGFKSFLIQNGLWTIDPNAPLLPIRPISRMPGLDSLTSMSQLPLVSPLNPAGGNDFQLELNQLRALLRGVDWPPFYEEMCGERGCAKANSGKAQLKVGVEFTLTGFENGVGKSKDYRVWRESSYASEYNKETQSLIGAVCQ